MRALILAAGYGTRLRPITDNLPKCLVPINGKPLLFYWLKMLTSSGINDIIINTHHHSDKVTDYIRDNEFNDYVKIRYEEKLLGTGGTILNNRDFFKDDSVIVIHGDNFSIFDLNLFISCHVNRPNNTVMTMMTFYTSNPESCGIVNVGSNGIVSAFYEKTKDYHGNLANAAVFIIEPEIFVYLESLSKDVIDFSAEVIPHFLNRISTFFNNIYHRDIGTLENYLKANQEYITLRNKYSGLFEIYGFN